MILSISNFKDEPKRIKVGSKSDSFFKLENILFKYLKSIILIVYISEAQKGFEMFFRRPDIDYLILTTPKNRVIALYDSSLILWAL